jgi:hypothetical protein
LKDDWETVRPTYQAMKNTGIETAVNVSLRENIVVENLDRGYAALYCEGAYEAVPV